MNTNSNSVMNSVSRSLKGTSALCGVRRVMDSAARAARHFVPDNSGNVGMMFAGMIIPTVALVGMSVDVGRALNERTIMQAALDSAVLAGGREYQTTGDTGAATAAASRFFDAAVSPEVDAELTTNEVDVNTNALKLAARVQVPTTFLRVLGVDEIEVSTEANAELAQGGLDKNLEVSIALDITGSMSGTKIADLKLAAKDLIDILVQDDQSEFTSRVALVPFSETVRPSADLLAAVREDSHNGNGYGMADASALPALTGGTQIASIGQLPWSARLASVLNQIAIVSPAHASNGNGNGNGNGNDNDNDNGNGNNGGGNGYPRCGDGNALCTSWTVENAWGNDQTFYLTPCLTERHGAHAFTDKEPNGQHYMSPHYGTWEGCVPVAEMKPLSSDKDALKDHVDTFVASGWTSGHLGTAWAWYMLSPKWAPNFPVESAPAEYHSEDVMKVAIIMTDGVYNTQYNHGIDDWYISEKSPNGTSNEQAIEYCEGMKAEGITVYTVGFALNNSNAIELLEDCASTSDHAFLASNGSELRQAFRNIGFKLTQLRLTK